MFDSKLTHGKFEDKPYAILNDKLCDNYEFCPSKKVCSDSGQAAIIFENDKISIDTSRCTGCGKCITFCGLFRIVKNKPQEIEWIKDFNEDPRTNELCQTAERFGCDVFDAEAFKLMNIDEIDKFIGSTASDTFNILEFVDAVNELCPFQGIKVDDIMSSFDQLGEYRKYIVESDEADIILEKYSLDDLPSILLLKDGLVAAEPISGRYKADSIKDEITLRENLIGEFKRRLEGATA